MANTSLSVPAGEFAEELRVGESVGRSVETHISSEVALLWEQLTKEREKRISTEKTLLQMYEMVSLRLHEELAAEKAQRESREMLLLELLEREAP